MRREQAIRSCFHPGYVPMSCILRECSGGWSECAFRCAARVHGEVSFLFTGDAPLEAELRMAQQYRELLQSDVLKSRWAPLWATGSCCKAMSLRSGTTAPEPVPHLPFLTVRWDRETGMRAQRVLQQRISRRTNRNKAFAGRMQLSAWRSATATGSRTRKYWLAWRLQGSMWR